MEIIFDTVDAVAPDESAVKLDESRRPVAISSHALALFLLVQLHSRQGAIANVAEVWPSQRDLDHYETPSSPTRSSPGSSHRAKAGKHQQNRKWFQEQLQHHRHHLADYPAFLRKHARHVLMLVLDHPPQAMEEANQRMVSAAEFDRLAMLFQPTDRSKALKCLSSLVPELRANGSAAAAKLEQWLVANVMDEEKHPLSNSSTPSRHSSHGSGPTSGSIYHLSDAVEMQGVVKATVVRGEDLAQSNELRIADCHDAVIYALAPMKTVSIFGCSDSTVVLGAVGQIVRIERCEKLQLFVACRRAMISTCHDCTFHLAVNRPPCLIGDNRFIQLAPYCTHYEELPAHLNAAGVTTGANMWDHPITVTRDMRGHAPDSPRGPAMATGPHSTSDSMLINQWSRMPPRKLLPFVIPFKGGKGPLGGGGATAPGTPSTGNTAGLGNLFPLPEEYDAALKKKVEAVADLRSEVKSAVLEEPRKRDLQAVIQAHFKEWLVASGNMRQIYDLARLEREES